ncbi:MAG: hypothetical protein KDJ36_16250, partial [Hyphomicrobiaceae bacterium]|nr:hypothetical protein [Hyphomicrobiaceae bacterium]
MSTTPTTYTMLSTGTFRMTDGSAAYRFTAGDIIPMQLAIALGLPGAGYTERSVFNATEEAEIVSLTETDLLTSLADSESDVAGAVETIAAAAANVVITVTLPTAASVVDQSVFIADRAYEVLSVAESHVVAGTDGSAVTLDVKKCT